jgi:hypothetical protein
MGFLPIEAIIFKVIFDFIANPNRNVDQDSLKRNDPK